MILGEPNELGCCQLPVASCQVQVLGGSIETNNLLTLRYHSILSRPVWIICSNMAISLMLEIKYFLYGCEFVTLLPDREESWRREAFNGVFCVLF